MKIQLKPGYVNEGIIEHILKFFHNIFNTDGSLKKGTPRALASAFFNTIKNDRKNKQCKKYCKDDVITNGTLIFGIPLIWEDDVIIDGRVCNDENNPLYIALNEFFQEIKLLASDAYVEAGEGFIRMAVPPPEVYVYEDHSGNLSGDTKGLAYSILRNGPPYSGKAEKILKKYDLLKK
ncbi:hypothetical protein IT402_00715 [Candidatus Nomurabacteria bacterium]|nr:hypothetical protein [Candidatus Nomurabacteria bacterium]